MTDLLAGFAGRRVLVTGHTGFKGAWLSRWLVHRGAAVTGFALDPEDADGVFAVSGLAGLMCDIRGDVRDAAALAGAFQAVEPEFVFHLAAQPLVRRSYREPRLTFETNVLGTVNLLECVRTAPAVRACVNVTTDKCYENRERPDGYAETDALGGYDPYSASKACSEIVTAAFRSSYFDGQRGSTAGIATARSGNVIGGGDWAEDRLIPDMVLCLSAGRPARVRAPRAVRPWLHVLDSLRGYLMLAARLAQDPAAWQGAWNFGPGRMQVRSVHEVVDRFLAAWGAGSWTDDSTGTHPHETGFLNLDTRKAADRLGWHPVLGLEAAIDHTAAWYRARRDGADMAAVTLGQIREFEAAASCAEGHKP
ncbi:MAG: CDP-glucose 4,6-dehydratase [Planctomycetota bacterium]